MTRKPTAQQVPNSMPAIKVLDCNKREYAHLRSNPDRKIVTMTSKVAK